MYTFDSYIAITQNLWLLFRPDVCSVDDGIDEAMPHDGTDHAETMFKGLFRPKG
jgi:hypothetical protein